MNRKNLIASAAAGMLLLLVAGIAVAAPGLDTAAENVPSEVELPAPETDVEGEDVEVADNGENANDNHGACVSAAAQDETEFDEPWKKGMFVSSVAKDESLTGSDCDYSSHLEAAETAEAPGNAPADAGAANENSSDAQTDGRSFGESTADSHRP